MRRSLYEYSKWNIDVTKLPVNFLSIHRFAFLFAPLLFFQYLFLQRTVSRKYAVRLSGASSSRLNHNLIIDWYQLGAFSWVQLWLCFGMSHEFNSHEDQEIIISNYLTCNWTQIYDGPNAASKLIGTYCNSEQLIQLESSSHVVFIRLITDVNNQGRGFELKFNASKWKEKNEFPLVAHCTQYFFICVRLPSTNSWFARCNR